MSTTADVIIIGGGIEGCSTAYYLAKRGITNVIVLEAQEIMLNGGASRNAGGVRQSGRDPRELPLALYGMKNIWPTLGEELGVDVEYNQGGNLRLGKTEEHLKTLTRLANNAAACGVGVGMISGDEARTINPYLSEEVIGASWCPTDGHANPLKTGLGFYKNALAMGVKFITGEKVLELRKVKGRLRKVIAEHGEYEADTIMVCAGAQSKEILSTVGINAPVRPRIDHCLVTEGQPHMFDTMLGTAEADFYGGQTNHGSFVFGGDDDLEGFDIYDLKTKGTSTTAPCVCRGIMKYFPKLAEMNIVRTWAGWIDITPDGVPVLGDCEEVPGLVTAYGFNAHGFGISPAIGYALSELIETGDSSTIDISGLHYNRFKAKF